jgi:hypothetical protein
MPAATEKTNDALQPSAATGHEAASAQFHRRNGSLVLDKRETQDQGHKLSAGLSESKAEASQSTQFKKKMSNTQVSSEGSRGKNKRAVSTVNLPPSFFS